MTKKQIFKFKKFEIDQTGSTMKVGTDGILLGAWCDLSDAKKVLDIGTGTGLIALMAAQRSREDAKIEAVEIDEDSYNQAVVNCKSSDWHQKINLYHLPIQEFAQKAQNVFDHIICNPPFFSGGTLSSSKDRNSVRHTIKLSHQDLLRSVRSLMSSSGKLSVILPHLEGLRFIEMAETYGFHCSKKSM